MGAKVLLVEDEPGIQLAVRGLLRRLGHDIDVAGTGSEAEELLADGTYDLVLTDLSLPDSVNGLDLVRIVRSQHPATPVVLLTAYGSDSVAREAMGAGAFDYVPKPFNNDDLRAVVARALAG